MSGVHWSKTSLTSEVSFLQEIKLRPREVKSLLNIQLARGKADVGTLLPDSHLRALHSPLQPQPHKTPEVPECDLPFMALSSLCLCICSAQSSTTFPIFSDTVKSYLSFRAKVMHYHARKIFLLLPLLLLSTCSP